MHAESCLCNAKPSRRVGDVASVHGASANAQKGDVCIKKVDNFGKKKGKKKKQPPKGADQQECATLHLSRPPAHAKKIAVQQGGVCGRALHWHYLGRRRKRKRNDLAIVESRHAGAGGEEVVQVSSHQLLP